LYKRSERSIWGPLTKRKNALMGRTWEISGVWYSKPMRTRRYRALLSSFLFKVHHMPDG
jgi:hypothetical protein